MVTNRRRFVGLAGLMLAAPALLSRGAQAAEMTLRLRHGLATAGHVELEFLLAWAASIRAASGGRIDVRLLPLRSRGGTARQDIEEVRSGQVELAWIDGGEVGRVFPRLDALQLPFVGGRAALINAQVAHDFCERHIGADIPELRLLTAVAGDTGLLHTTGPINNLEELRGARLLPPTPLAGETLQAFGAIAVMVEPALLGEALKQNVLDGGVAPWGSSPPELSGTGFHSDLGGPPSLFMSAKLLMINRARFDTMPEELRNVLAERSGLAAARLAGQTFDAASAADLAAAQARGTTILQIPEPERLRWIEAARPVVAGWIDRSSAQGFDGNALLGEIQGLYAKYSPPPAPPERPAPQPSAAQPPAAPAEAAAAPAIPAETAAVPTGPEGIMLRPLDATPVQPGGSVAPAPAAAQIPAVPAQPSLAPAVPVQPVPVP